MESVVRWLRKIYQENTRQSKAIKVWLQDDVRQHDARLEEYQKQTRLLSEILIILKKRGADI